jgi:protease-4
VSGKGDDGTIGSETFAEAIKKIRKDSSYKAMVLRINSPGGSALASDVIWREVLLTKKVKPVVVSMGAVAASGGYFIAAPADVIVAQPNTITGSIGVFGMLLNAKELLNNKLGIKVETVKFGEFADIGRPDRPLNEAEYHIIQKAIDKIYNDFVQRVAEGRKMSNAQVDSIAQGRVWSAADAKKIGLVDEFGGLDDAIKIAAKRAGLEKYRSVSLPEQKETFDELLKMLGDETSAYFLRAKLGENYSLYQRVQQAMRYQGVQARMAFDVEIN